MKIISVVGARPNFMKIAPINNAIINYNHSLNTLVSRQNDTDTQNLDLPNRTARKDLMDILQNKPELINHSNTANNLQFPSYNLRHNIIHFICHTGQHYDEKMSSIFFEELGLPRPDFYLGVGGGSHAEQTAKIMIQFEKILITEKPDLIIVVGDVNSTIACSLTAVKMGIRIAHVEAGLRSFDRSMPEEINRILTDSISDYLFVTEKSGLINLRNEGIDENKIHFVGNVMIDTLIKYLPIITDKKLDKYSLFSSIKKTEQNGYILVTMHRPSNVDDKTRLKKLLEMLQQIAKKRKVIFPIHPRTSNNIERFGLKEISNANLIFTEPIGYIDFITLIKHAELIITDSGGIQEESTFFGVQCVTVRRTTERPVTVEVGTNHLVGDDFDRAEKIVEEILNGKCKIGKVPDLWDGRASERIVEILIQDFNKNLR